MNVEKRFQINVQGDGDVRLYDLPLGTISIGRRPDSDIALQANPVSRRHAQIINDGESCQIVDLNSANGTFLNGQRLAANEPTPLVPGDTVTIVDYILTLREIPPDIAAQHQSVVKPEPEESPNSEPILPSLGAPTQKLLPYVGKAPPGLSRHSLVLLNYLPEIYQLSRLQLNGVSPESTNSDTPENFLSRFLAIIESILLPLHWTAENFDLFLAIDSSPTDFLPWLRNWFLLTGAPEWSEKQQRELLADAHRIFSRRGTRWSLEQILSIYIGKRPRIIDDSEDLPPHKFRVLMPVRKGDVDESFVERIINEHKPAHTQYSLDYD